MLFVTFAAFSILGHHLEMEGFFHDGYLYSAMSANVLRNPQIFPMNPSPFHFPDAAIHPPLTFLIQAFLFFLFGTSTLVARFSGVIWSVFSVGVMCYFLLKENKPSWAINTTLCLLLTIPFLRKTRFPNTDILLTVLYTLGVWGVYYLEKFKQNRKKFNLMMVLFSVMIGLGLLTKGPNAIIFYICLFFYFLYKKSLKSLFSLVSLISLVFIPLSIFSLWPLALYKSGAIEQFSKYIEFQVIGTAIKSRGKASWELWVYFHFLFFYCMPWGLVSLINLGKNIFYKHLYKDDEKSKDLYVLFLIGTLSVLVPFSFVKFKYSHYIMPIYPVFAGFNGYFLTQVFKKFQSQSKVNVIFVLLVVGVNFVFNILPLPINKEKTRDKELYFLSTYLKNTNQDVTAIFNVNSVYSFYNLINYASFYHPKIHVYVNNLENSYNLWLSLDKNRQDSCVFIVSREDELTLKRVLNENKYIYYPIYSEKNKSLKIYFVVNKNSI